MESTTCWRMIWSLLNCMDPAPRAIWQSICVIIFNKKSEVLQVFSKTFQCSFKHGRDKSPAKQWQGGYVRHDRLQPKTSRIWGLLLVRTLSRWSALDSWRYCMYVDSSAFARDWRFCFVRSECGRPTPRNVATRKHIWLYSQKPSACCFIYISSFFRPLPLRPLCYGAASTSKITRS